MNGSGVIGTLLRRAGPPEVLRTARKVIVQDPNGARVNDAFYISFN